MAFRMDVRLSAFTIILKPIWGLSDEQYALCGKDSCNNVAILSACDRFSQSITITPNTLEVVEFMASI